MLITHSVSFDITFGVCQHHHNVGSRHLPLVHVRMTSKLKYLVFSISHSENTAKKSTKNALVKNLVLVIFFGRMFDERLYMCCTFFPSSCKSSFFIVATVVTNLLKAIRQQYLFHHFSSHIVHETFRT